MATISGRVAQTLILDLADGFVVCFAGDFLGAVFLAAVFFITGFLALDFLVDGFLEDAFLIDFFAIETMSFLFVL